MSIKSGLSFLQTTQNALQEAAALFRQDKAEDAYHVLHENVFLPQTQGKLTKAQADAVYRSMIPDPLSAPETPFSKRSCIPAIALRGHALKDLIAHYNLPIGEERSAILKAANILETEGDEEKAWKILHRALIPSGNNEDIIKEVHRVMIDSLRTPTSSFLQKHVKNHPAILDDNFLRAQTLECLSTHFFDKEVVEGAKVQLDSPILEFRAKTREALQQAAQLFRERRIEEASELLKDAIWVPYEKGELTEAQVDIVYKTLQDPYDPQTEFAKREFHPLFVLRAQALSDLVNFYSNVPSSEKYSGTKMLANTKVKEAVLTAASLIETQEDMEGAWKILNDVLPSAMREEKSGVTDEFVKELRHVMNDNLRNPTSSFLQKRIQDNPSLIDENRLRARALESLSRHIFDDEVVRGVAPQFKVFAGMEKATLEKGFAHVVLPFLGTQGLSSFMRTSKSSKETVIKSIKNRKEVSWRELSDLRRMGIRLNKDMLSGVRVINKDGIREVDIAELEYILSLCGEHIEALDFGARRYKREFLAIIGKHCPNLLSFAVSEIDNFPVDARALEPLASGCPKLQSFSLTHSMGCSGLLAPLAHYCPNLRRIDINSTSGIKDSDIETLVSGCTLLTDFSAEGIHLGDGTLKALGSCHLLKSLKLSFCYEGNRTTCKFSTEGMKALVRGCRALEELSLIGCYIKDDVLAVVGEAGLPLTKIIIAKNMPYDADEQPAITSSGILSLIHGYPKVRELDFSCSHVDDDVMEAIAEKCTLLTKLNVSQNLRDIGDISVNGVHVVASKCTHLTHLEIGGVGVGGNEQEGEEREGGFLQALTDSKRLASIFFTSVHNYATAQEIISFVRKHTELRHIQLPHHHITDEVLFAIASSCPDLESLEAMGDRITPKGLSALGRGCPHITRLRLTHRGQAGDELLKALGENFPELTHLDISYNRRDKTFSREGFVALGKGCHKLSELIVAKCGMSENLLHVICSACRSLKRIDCSGDSFNFNDTIGLRELINDLPGLSIKCTTPLYDEVEIGLDSPF